MTIGTPFANRQNTQVEPLLGLFVNTLALRVRLSEALDVAGLLARIKALSLDAYAHQDLPFEHVFEALQPVRSLNHSPIFQVMLALNNTPSSTLAIRGLTLQPIRLPRTSAYLDLSLFLEDTGGAIVGNFEYASTLFERETVERFATQLAHLIGEFVHRERALLRDISLLDERARHRLLVEFNATHAEFPDGELIHELIERNAREHPEAIAVVLGERALAYAELNRRANQLAHRLIELGVEPDARVAIFMERGPDLIVGLLAILKAGGAYVPLDAGYPVERLNYILEDSKPVAVLTQASLRQQDRVHVGDCGPR